MQLEKDLPVSLFTHPAHLVLAYIEGYYNRQGSIPLSGISPLNRQSAKPPNPVSSKSRKVNPNVLWLRACKAVQQAR
jgi:hypothetical protein